MVDEPKAAELPLPTRVAILEAKVRLLSFVLKWLAGSIVTALIAYFIQMKL